MSNITVHNLDDSIKHKLRMRAAANGRSMEDEVRTILRMAVEPVTPIAGAELLQRIRARFAALGDVDLPQPEREALREPPTLAG